jgi:hypothetical protein
MPSLAEIKWELAPQLESSLERKPNHKKRRRSETESGGEESSEGIEIPRLLKSIIKGEFPAAVNSTYVSALRSPALPFPPPVPSQSPYRGLSQQNAAKQQGVQLWDFPELPQRREGAYKSDLTFDLKYGERGERASGPENEPRLEVGESSIGYEPSESIFSLPDTISSQSSGHDTLGTTGELVMFLIKNTQLRDLYPSLCRHFEFATFKSEFRHLLSVFSKDLSKEATIPIEKESVRFVSQQRRRISHAIGQEVFGLKDQSLFESISQRQQQDIKERIEQYLQSAVLPKGGKDELPERQEQEQVLDNDSSDDEEELVPLSKLEHIKNFLIKSKAFEKFRIGITELATRGDKWPIGKQPHHNVMDLQNKAEEDDNPSEVSDYQASSGLSVPAEPQVRKTVQVQNYSLPDMLHRLHLGVLQLLRPRLDVGHRRLEWQCNCGMPLYSDFRGDDEEVNKLVMEIQAMDFSSHRAVMERSDCQQALDKLPHQIPHRWRLQHRMRLRQHEVPPPMLPALYLK